MCAHRKFPGQFAVTENFDSIGGTVSKTDSAQRCFIHARALLKLIQFADIDRDKLISKADIVESAFGNAPDERHLAAFEADANGTARTRRLAFAAAPAGFAMAAGFTLAESFDTVLRAGTRFQIM